MRKLYIKQFLAICFLLVASRSFAQFKFTTHAKIGQTLSVDSVSGISTFLVDFKTSSDSSYWKYSDDTQTSFTITVNKCQTYKGLQVNVYTSDTVGATTVVTNSDFECRSYTAQRNPARISSMASLLEILGKFETKNAGTSDSVKNVTWKPSACLFDLDTTGSDQAFGACPGMYKRVEYGFAFSFSGVSVTDDDILFDIDTYDEGNTGKTASYNLVVVIGSDTTTVKDFYVTGSGKKSVKLAEAIGKNVSAFSNKTVYIFLKTLGTGTAMAKGSYDPTIIFDNFLVAYQSPSWIDPAAGIKPNGTYNNSSDPAKGVLNQESLYGMHLQTTGRIGTFTISNDWVNAGSLLLNVFETGAIKAKDSTGNYTIDVAYTYTADNYSTSTRGSYVIAAPSSGSVDDDIMVYFKATRKSTAAAYTSIELNCGVRIYYNFYFQAVAPIKKVGYFTLDKSSTMASTAQVDPVLLMLQADDSLIVTVNKLTLTTDSVADISNYDMIVIQESLSGSAKILMPGQPLSLSNINIPVVYNKTYAFKKGRALTSSTGGSTGAELTGCYAITANATNQSSDLFKGLTFTGDSVTVFKAGATDLGADGSKALSYVKSAALSNANTMLARPNRITSGDSAVISFSDIPAGTTIDSETLGARTIVLGMNYGAICKNNGTNITSAGLTLWRNAVYMAAGLTVPSTLYENVATLDTLYSSTGTLSPSFSATTYSYTLNLPSGTTSATLNATSTTASSITVPTISGLTNGIDTSYNVIAYSPLGNDSTVYTVKVHVTSSNAALASLAVSVGTLSPAFSPDVTSYAVNTPTGTTSMNITAVASNNYATVSGAGALTFASDGKTATILVTAEDGTTTKTYTVTITVGVNVNEFSMAGLKIYPNPATDYIKVAGLGSNATYTVFNAQGKQIATGTTTSSSVQINLSAYKQGIYLMQVEMNGKLYTSRFIKE